MEVEVAASRGGLIVSEECMRAYVCECERVCVYNSKFASGMLCQLFGARNSFVAVAGNAVLGATFRDNVDKLRRVHRR